MQRDSETSGLSEARTSGLAAHFDGPIKYEPKRHYNPTLTRDLSDDYRTGVQHIYRFENGYGASVVQHSFSYGGDEGLWELAVVTIEDPADTPSGINWHLCYDTPVTSDVIGYLTEDEVQDYLDQIAGLQGGTT